MINELKIYQKRITRKFKEYKKQINKISLLVLIISVATVGIYYWYLNYKYNSQFTSITIYFSDKNLSKLVPEKRKIKKEKDNILIAINQLIYGPISNKHRSTVPRSTKIKSIWYSNNNLDINFSKELIKDINPKIKDGRLIVFSILATLFTSSNKLNTIKLFIEDKPLKTILGNNDFNKTYKRKPFMAKLDLDSS
jgi:spore germination protein GerM